MKRNSVRRNDGSTLVVTISVVAMLLALLGAAVEYSTQVSRTTQRSRNTALAMEIADGHLEMLFTNWRNIYRTTWTTYSTSYQGTGGTDYSLLPTNYFYTTCSGCTTSYSSPAPVPIPYMNPAAVPPAIPLPASTLFPSGANYTVKQYRIQAVNPMIELDANENAVDVNGAAMSRSAIAPAAYGPNDWQYSYYYLAAVDVTVPALTGDVTAKVRRVFEKKFDNPWTYAMFYVDDLELQPGAPLTITGPIHTNASLYIGTSNFTAQGPSWPNYPTSGRVEYGSDYVNGYSPRETQHSATPTAPNFAKSDSSLSLSDMPPSQVSPYLPFGWNLNLASGGSANDDSYHELIERAGSGTDPIAGIRYITQKPYVIDTQNVLAGYAGTPGNSYQIFINEHYWKFADAAARSAPGSYAAADVKKVAFEPNNGGNYFTNGTYWRMSSISGTAPTATPTWVIIPERTTYAFPNAAARAASTFTTWDPSTATFGTGTYPTYSAAKPAYAYQYDDDTYWKLTGLAGGVPSWTQVTSPTNVTVDTTWPATIVTWTFSNAANRVASGSYDSNDINKVCFQTDSSTYWRLTSVNKSGSIYTPVWTPALQVDAVTIKQWDGTTATPLLTSGNDSSGNKKAASTYDTIYNLLTPGDVLRDNREGGLVRLTSLNVNGFSTLATNGTLSNFSGVLYMSDFGASYVTPSGTSVPGNPVTCGISSASAERGVVRRAIRLKNGATLLGKLTVVSDNPVYIQGDYNTGVNPPSNSGTYTSPTASGYTRWASAVIGDSINVLSSAWTDANSTSTRPSRVPTNTTINTGLVSGNVPSDGTNYSGGGENFVRFLEDWSKNNNVFCYYGSMVQLYKSQQGTGTWSSGGQSYQPPTLKWFYDINFSADHHDNAHWGSPPGNLQIAAYLQQQRWYQVY